MEQQRIVSALKGFAPALAGIGIFQIALAAEPKSGGTNNASPPPPSESTGAAPGATPTSSEPAPIDPLLQPEPPLPAPGRPPQLDPQNLDAPMSGGKKADGRLRVSPEGTAKPASDTAEAPKVQFFKVSKFSVSYGTDVRKRNPRLPTESELANTSVKLTEKGGKFYAESGDPAILLAAPTPPPAAEPADAAKKEKQATPKVKPAPVPTQGDVARPLTVSLGALGGEREFSKAALQSAYDAMVKALNKRGLVGVYLLTNVDPAQGNDARSSSGQPVEVKIFVNEVAMSRTIARRIPFRTGDLPKINDDEAADGNPIKDPKHLWIKTKSPIKDGGLIDKQRLQDYLSRLNRFPGRRVDSAINSSGKPGKVILDYLIQEQKPLLLYYQIANNGSEETGEWRHSLGMEYKQLINSDDLLRLEVVTSDFTSYLSAFASYEVALVKPDYLKIRPYGSYGKYSAEDVGVELGSFKGTNWTIGAAMTWTPLYWHAFPLDITLGAEWFNVTVDNGTFGQEASGSFILPYLGIGTSKVTDRFTIVANVEVQTSIGGPSQSELDGLGRFNAADSFVLLKWGLATSFYLEPLFLGSKWGKNVDDNGDNWKRARLAHEVGLSFRGQYAAGDKRLIPQLEFIAGGLNTVRGYPESFTSGDTGFVGTAEYRLHLPRLFRPASVKVPAKAPKKAKDGSAAPAPGTPPAQPDPLVNLPPSRAQEASSRFAFRPSRPGSNADWDLIFRAFTDYGQTINNDFQIATDKDRTLLSAGVGFELQVNKPELGRSPLMMSLRVDYGIALMAQDELVREPVASGDGRLHVSGTIAW